MVGLVIVSHSQKLAEGVIELAEQMTRGTVVMESAGGIDDAENPIGTDPMSVMAAIESVGARTDDDILVLMDLGSALMSAEAALDFLSDDLKKRVKLCAAPIVEGTIAAAVQASGGASLEFVVAEAISALDVKKEQLAPLTGDSVSDKDQFHQENSTGEELRLELLILNKFGLHARPTASLVTTAGRFKSRILISKGDKTVSAKSYNQVALLAVKNGETVTITASGVDAPEAIKALQKLHENNFGERDEDMAAFGLKKEVQAQAEEGVLIGSPASEGYCVGKAFVHQARLPEVRKSEISDPEKEVAKLNQAIAAALTEIEVLQKDMERSSGKSDAAIFGVHRMILEDDEMRGQAADLIKSDKVNAAFAWYQVMEGIAANYRELDDSYMQARAADVLDCGGRVLRIITGDSSTVINPEEPSIIVAHDLTPSDIAGVDPRMVLGLVTEVGGATSHAAILARSLGIPAVIGTGPGLDEVLSEQTVALDGFSGRFFISPQKDQLDLLMKKRDIWLAELAEVKAKSVTPAITADGVKIGVMGNIGKPAEASDVLGYGAEGVGLFRTEFLFQNRDQAPDEDEQFEAYVAAAKAMNGNPVIIRTLDVGGDKQIKYLDMPVEDNPFLGERGIRFCMARLDLFKVQLRALLKAATDNNIWIMYPMVSGLCELESVFSFQNKVREELISEGFKIAEKIKTGIMVEVPSAAVEAGKLGARCDFFSIGTNDLTQYVMAADRGNRSVSKICDSLNPAVLRMIKNTCEAAAKAQIEVGMCGELAGNSAATPLLLGLGLNELSMSGPAIPAVKEAVRAVNMSACQELAEKVLQAASGTEVRKLLDDFKW